MSTFNSVQPNVTTSTEDIGMTIKQNNKINKDPLVTILTNNIKT